MLEDKRYVCLCPNDLYVAVTSYDESDLAYLVHDLVEFPLLLDDGGLRKVARVEVVLVRDAAGHRPRRRYRRSED